MKELFYLFMTAYFEAKLEQVMWSFNYGKVEGKRKELFQKKYSKNEKRMRRWEQKLEDYRILKAAKNEIG